jgi:glycosyltransferase involved in cell wall biosynthesis
MNQRVILNMIVKNEAHVIERCLASVRPMITHWCIVDTGSTDGTQDVIRRALADLPGELHERPWKDFGYNRSEALELGRALVADPEQDYFFIIDADETLVYDCEGWQRPVLTEICYRLAVEFGDQLYGRNCLVSASKPWRYTGVLHEYIHAGEKVAVTKFAGAHVFVRSDGARSRQTRQEKYRKDAALLERAVQDEPTNERYVFYLAQSYRSAGDYEKAREWYCRRVAMAAGTWPEETWFAQYQLARMSQFLELEATLIHSEFLLAHEMRPWRAEPLFELAHYFRERNAHAVALVYAAAAAELPFPKQDQIFVLKDYYAWMCRDEHAFLLAKNRQRDRAIAIWRELLAGSAVPEAHRPRVQRNLEKAEQMPVRAPAAANA